MSTSEDESSTVEPDESVRPVEGPLAYRNWNAMSRAPEAAPSEGAEYLLFGDTPATGGHWSLGPYEVINTIAGAVHASGAGAPPIALRVWIHLGRDDWSPSLASTDVTAYTGTHLADEIAALLGLLTARRLRAGGMVRRFDSRTDPGTPYADAGVEPLSVRPRGRRLLPRQGGTCSLLEEHRALLASYPLLPAKRAVALARAARAYRDALWIGETEPELAWLLLVSAIECAANADKIDMGDPLTRLRMVRPRLVKKMTREGLSTEVQQVIASEVARLFGATEKFLGFLSRFAPKVGPEPRPLHGGLPWADGDAMLEVFGLVYDHRSNALHEAIALPVPMLREPRVWEPGSGFDEVPSGLASGALGGSWVREDTPMLLHAFEYIVQHALVAWWRGGARGSDGVRDASASDPQEASAR